MKTKRIFVIWGMILLFIAKTGAQKDINTTAYYCGLHNNPAGRSMLNHTRITFSFCDYHFTKEMMQKNLGCSMVRQGNVVHFGVEHWGYARYGEVDLHVGYGRNFGNKMGLCIRGHYIMNHAQHYPTRHGLNLDFSAYYQLRGDMHIAISICNPFHLRYFGERNNYLPLSFTIIGIYQSHDHFAEGIFYTQEFPGSYDVGVRFEFRPKAQLQLGGTFTNNRLCIAVHTQWRRFICRIDAGWYYRGNATTRFDLEYLHYSSPYSSSDK